MSPTSIPNLYLIAGASDSMNIANINTEQKQKIIQNLRTIDADYLVIDLGAGTNVNTIDFFLISDLSILVLLPEPTSIENAYRFIKTAYFRRLKLIPSLSPIFPIIDTAMDPKNNEGIKTPSDMFREVNRLYPELATQLKEEITKFKPKLILNQVRTQTDIDIGFSIKTVTKRYFGIDMDYIGYVDYDSSAWQAVRRKKPVMTEFPTSKVVSSIERMAQYLLKRHGHFRNDL
jgi:flagellar biosynthesis protein FlhG